MDNTKPRTSFLCIVDQIGGLSNGAAIRQHHLIRAIAALGDTEVVVLDRVVGGHEGDLAKALGASVSVVCVPPISKAEAVRRMLRHPLLPWRLARSDTSRIAEHIAKRIARRGDPDVLWVSSLAGWMALTVELRSRAVFDLIDRPTVFQTAQLKATGRRWMRVRRQRRRGTPLRVKPPDVAFVLKSLDGWLHGYLVERWLTRSCRLVVSCNPDELPRRAGNRHRVVPNCVDATGHRPPVTSATLRLLVPAGYKYPPNLDGAEWFLLDVLPEIRKVIGHCEVVLAGSYPPGFDEEASAAGALATGWVPDMAKLYLPGTVVVVPLLAGSGTRVKIIEAWSMCVPVVATPRGANGLGGRDGVELLLARTPSEFAAACDRLRSPELAEGIARAGRRLYERRYAAGVVSADLKNLLVDLFEIPLPERRSWA